MWQKTLHDFEQGTIDILVGTQTITKGYHFPNVTLVGVIWADLNLHFPFYTASETLIQQLIQVAGRAGRDKKNGHVIVQTMTNDPIFSLLHEQKYLSFYQQEIRSRQEVKYPPYIRFAEIELKHGHEQTVEQETNTVIQELRNRSKLYTNVSILGPSKPANHTIKRIHSPQSLPQGPCHN